MKKLLLPLIFASTICFTGCSKNTEKTIISTPNAPAAIGPYSQGVIIDNIAYLSGQIALDPTTGLLVGTNVKEQTTQVFKNISAILEAANTNLDNVIKTTVYLVDMNDFNDMNSVYSTYFKEGNYPSRSCVEVSELPKGALVEIEVTAIVK